MRLSFAPTLFFSSLSLLGLAIPATAHRFGNQFQNRGATRTQTSATRGNDVIAARQYRARRDVVDTCIDLNGDALTQLTGLTLDIDICLCLKDLNVWLDTNVDATILQTQLERLEAQALVESLMETHGTTCNLPSHSVRTCGTGFSCAIVCINGFTPGPDGTCICAEPNTVCNGECGSYPDGCISPVPLKRSAPQKITTLAQAQKVCQNKSVCGIAGRKNTLEFDCVDTTTAPDSCGGCMVPHPFPVPHPSKSVGVECGRLPGVLASKCSKSRCVVTQCHSGLHPSADASQCVAETNDVGPQRTNGGSTNATASTVTLNSQLHSQLEAIVAAVSALADASEAVPAVNTPALDYLVLVRLTIDAVVKLLNSNTPADTVANVNAIVDLSSDFLFKVTKCACIQSLRLEDLVAKLDALIILSVDLKTWLLNNPVVTTIPSSGSTAVAVPNTSRIPIDLNDDVLLAVLAKVIAVVDVHVNVLPQVVAKISALAKLAINLASSASSLPLTSESPVAFPRPEVLALPLDTSLINAVIRATINVAGSTTVADLAANVDVLHNAIVTASATVEKVNDSNLAPFLISLDAVGKAALDVKAIVNRVPQTADVFVLDVSALIHSLQLLL